MLTLAKSIADIVSERLFTPEQKQTEKGLSPK